MGRFFRETSRAPRRRDLEVLALAEQWGLRLAQGARMVPLLLTFDERTDAPTATVALTDPNRTSDDEARPHLLEAQPLRRAIVRTGELDGQVGLVVDLGNVDVVFVFFIPFDDPQQRVQCSVRASPLRLEPTMQELELARRAAAHVRSVPEHLALMWDPRHAPRWLLFDQPPGPDPLGERLDEAGETLADLPAFVVGAQHRGRVVVCVASHRREHLFEEREFELTLLGSTHRRR